jgi:hypothetical protein
LDNIIIMAPGKAVSADYDEERKKTERRRIANAKYNRSTKGQRTAKALRNAHKPPQSKVLRKMLHQIMDSGTSVAQCAVIKLLMSDWNSLEGISFHMDAPLLNYPLCNIDRPAVLRTHYGRDCPECDESAMDYIMRYVYGTGSGTGSVGTDPRSWQTKSMSLAMWELGECIRQHLITRESLFCDKMDLEDEFNTATILLYMGSDVIDECEISSLGFHTDCEYTAKGQFVASNSQKENTPAVILTLGDARTLYMKKRKVGSNGSWMNNKDEKIHEYLLRSGSIFVLDPADEVPRRRGCVGEAFSQFQHGGVKLDKGLSMAIVFRTVSTKAKINLLKNTKELGEKEVYHLNKVVQYRRKDRKCMKEHYDDAYSDALGRKDKMENQLKTYVKKRFDEKTLISGREVVL